MVSKFNDEEFYSKFCSEIYYSTKDKIESGIDIHRNLIDPFTALLVTEFQQLTKEEWLEKETNRQIEKIIEGMVGRLHEIAIGCFDDWEKLSPQKEPDCVSGKNKQLIECKNKYKTMKQGKLQEYYEDLKGHLKKKKYKGYTAFLVNILPDYSKGRPINKPWIPKEGIKRRDDIRIIDGKSFYSLISGDENFLKKLLTEHVPKAIERCNIHVSHNFSSNNIIELINQLYEKTFSFDFGDLEYKDLKMMYNNEPSEFKEEFEHNLLKPNWMNVWSSMSATKEKIDAWRVENPTEDGKKANYLVAQHAVRESLTEEEKERVKNISNNEFTKLKNALEKKYSTIQEYLNKNPGII